MENIKSLVAYRFEKGEGCLKASRIAIEAEDYYTAANRSYYAVLHAIRTVFVREKYGKSWRHLHIIFCFRQIQLMPADLSCFRFRTEAVKWC